MASAKLKMSSRGGCGLVLLGGRTHLNIEVLMNVTVESGYMAEPIPPACGMLGYDAYHNMIERY